MTGGEIAKKDTRLFLFQALDTGIRNGLFEKSILAKLEKEGAELSIGFAKRYYPQIVAEAYLRQASYNVLGIINLGLHILCSESLVANAVSILKKKGFVGIFREGWTRLVRLSEMRSIVEEKEQTSIEREYAELFMAEPEKDWIGIKEYKNAFNFYSNELVKKEFKEWMVSEFVKKDYKDKGVIDELEKYEKEVIRSLLFSLLINKKPYAPLRGEYEIDMIVEQLAMNRADEIIEKINRFLPYVPDRFKAAFQGGVDYLKKNIIPFYQNILSKKGPDALKVELVKSILYKSDPDTESRYKYEAYKERLNKEIEKGMNGKKDSIEEIINNYLNREDVSERIAAIDYILENRFKELDTKNILDLMDTANAIEWTGKINWSSLPVEVVDEVVEKMEGTIGYLSLLEDVYSHIEQSGPWYFAAKLSLFTIHTIFQNVPRSRCELMKNIHLQANEETITFLKDSDDNMSLIFLFHNDDWYSAWIELNMDEEEAAFHKLYFGGQEYFGWSPEKAADHLFEKVKYIAKKWKMEGDDNWEDAPFYAVGLEKSLKKVLPKAVFKKIKARMEKKL